MNTNYWKKYFMNNNYWQKYLVNTNSYKYKEAERVSAVFKCSNNGDGSRFNKNVFHDYYYMYYKVYEYKYHINVINLQYKYCTQILIDTDFVRASSEALAMQRPFVSVIYQLFLDSNTRLGYIGEIFDGEIQISIMS